MHVLDACIAAGREGAQEIERRRPSPIGVDLNGAGIATRASRVNSMLLITSLR